MQSIILVLHVLVAIFLVTLVLMQHGKGADVGASFGAGASSTVFGSQGSTSILMKITAILAFIFFMTSLGLAYMNAHTKQAKSLVDGIPAATTTADKQKNITPPPANIPEIFKSTTVPAKPASATAAQPASAAAAKKSKPAKSTKPASAVAKKAKPASAVAKKAKPASAVAKKAKPSKSTKPAKSTESVKTNNAKKKP